MLPWELWDPMDGLDLLLGTEESSSSSALLAFESRSSSSMLDPLNASL
jgi:hypothetical protein